MLINMDELILRRIHNYLTADDLLKLGTLNSKFHTKYNIYKEIYLAMC